jgi:hypothetical protein
MTVDSDTGVPACEPTAGSVVQHHDGPGDNIAGHKYVYAAITPDTLQRPIIDILTAIREKKLDLASEKLQTLRKTGNLHADTLTLLDMLTTLIHLSDGQAPLLRHSEILPFIDTSTAPWFADVVYSALIRLDMHLQQPANAVQRFTALDSPGAYTQEAFYELVATQGQLHADFESRALQLSEPELCGMVRGALRVKVNPLAISAATKLCQTAPTLNSQVLLARTKLLCLNDELGNHHYWQISASTRDTLFQVADDIVRLVEHCNAEDQRVVNDAAALLEYTGNDYPPLSTLCWQYIEKIERVNATTAAKIRRLYERRPKEVDDILDKIERASHDAGFKQDLVSQIVSQQQISADDSTLLAAVASPVQIRAWIEDGGAVSSDDQIEQDFSTLELQALSTTERADQLQKLRQATLSFTLTHNDDLHTLNPVRLLALAERLLDIGLADKACDVLQPLVITHDLWLSPIVRTLLRALLAAQQFRTLNTLLSEIETPQWDAFVWLIKARQQDVLNNAEAALQAVTTAVDLKDDYLDAWYCYFGLLKKYERPDREVITVLNSLPEVLFERPHPQAIALLFEMACRDQFQKAETTLLQWFLNDPDAMAKAFSDFHFNLIASGKEPATLTPIIGCCVGGARYRKNGILHTQLVVDKAPSNHPAFLTVDSPIGHAVQRLHAGESTRIGMFDIELIETSPPMWAFFIWRLSCDRPAMTAVTVSPRSPCPKTQRH